MVIKVSINAKAVGIQHQILSTRIREKTTAAIPESSVSQPMPNQRAPALAPAEVLPYPDEELAWIDTHGRKMPMSRTPIEIQKIIIARRMGVSRTRERAAPTPSTSGTPA